MLVAGRYSYLLLAAFTRSSTWKFQKWAIPFVWIGVVPITIYFGGRFIDFEALAKAVCQGLPGGSSGTYAQLNAGDDHPAVWIPVSSVFCTSGGSSSVFDGFGSTAAARRIVQSQSSVMLDAGTDGRNGIRP